MAIQPNHEEKMFWKMDWKISLRIVCFPQYDVINQRTINGALEVECHSNDALGVGVCSSISREAERGA